MNSVQSNAAVRDQNVAANVAQRIQNAAATAGVAASRADKARVVAPIVCELYAEFVKPQADPLQMRAIREEVIEGCNLAVLCERRDLDPRTMGVHPVNRDFQGLLAIDVHDLLLRICVQGFAWKACEFEIDVCAPSGTERDDFAMFNVELVKRSEGLLAPVVADSLEYFTTAGSHTTAAIRLYALPGARAVHDELSRDGLISQAAILEKYPSMRKPLGKLPCNVFCKELCEACTEVIDGNPVAKLAIFLSRAANAGHATQRTATVVQKMFRLHSVSIILGKGRTPPTDAEVIRVAAQGDRDFLDTAPDLLAFVKEHAGGRVPWLLRMVSEFEQGLPLKRVLRSKDLLALSRVTLPNSEIFIAGMVMAMVASPSEYADGEVSTLFGSADYGAAQGHLRVHAIAASKIQYSAIKYLDPVTDDPLEKTNALNDLLVMLVMHVFAKNSKSAKTRRTYSSLDELARDWHKTLLQNAVARNGATLPLWEHGDNKRRKTQKAPADPAEATEQSIASQLRSTTMTGEVPNEEFERLGFAIGKVVALRSAPTAKAWEITNVTPTHVFVAVHPLVHEDGAEIAGEPVQRADFIANFVIGAPAVELVLAASEVGADEYHDPTTTADFLIPLWQGRIRESLQRASDANPCAVKILGWASKAETRVVAAANYDVGDLVLVPVTTSVIVTKDISKALPNGAELIGNVGTAQGSEYMGYLMPKITKQHRPQQTGCQAKETHAFLPAFWAVKEKADSRQVNMKASSHGVGRPFFNVPTLVNSRKIKKGDELVRLQPTRNIKLPLELGGLVDETVTNDGKGGGKGGGNGGRKGKGGKGRRGGRQ